MNPVFFLITMICTVIFWVVIASVILSWLIAFNVINTRNPTMKRICDGVNSIAEKLYAPIRKIMPTIFGGMDISPVIVLILLQLVQYTLGWMTLKFGI